VVEENALCLTMFEPCDVVWFPSPLSEDGVAATHKSQGFESGQPNREVLLLCSHKTHRVSFAEVPRTREGEVESQKGVCKTGVARS